MYNIIYLLPKFKGSRRNNALTQKTCFRIVLLQFSCRPLQLACGNPRVFVEFSLRLCAWDTVFREPRWLIHGNTKHSELEKAEFDAIVINRRLLICGTRLKSCFIPQQGNDILKTNRFAMRKEIQFSQGGNELSGNGRK
jgi:hypothetical protein